MGKGTDGLPFHQPELEIMLFPITVGSMVTEETANIMRGTD